MIQTSVKQNWRLIGIGIACGVPGAILIELVVEAWGQPLWTMRSAGWAQAFGVVGAVVFAGMAASRAAQRSDFRARRNSTRFLSEIEDLAGSVVRAIGGLDAAVKTQDASRLDQQMDMVGELEAGFRRLTQLSARDWPSPFLAVAVDRLGDAVRHSAARVAAVLPYVRSHAPVPADVMDSFETARKGVGERFEDFNRQMDVARRLD